MENDMNNEKQKPVHEVRIGGNKAAIWLHENGEGRRRFAIRFARLHRTGEGPTAGWKTTEYFGRDDLLEVAKIADAAHSWCLANALDRAN